jgi:ketosteroid isomerase-like protein
MVRLGLVVALLCLAGCDPGESSREDERQVWLAEVLAADRGFNAQLARGNVKGFADHIAPDAVFLGDTTLRGREAIVSGWSTLLDPDGDVTLRWSPVSAEVSMCGDLAYTVGKYRLESVGEAGGIRTATGEYVTVWRRDGDGSWRAVVDSGTVPRPQTDDGNPPEE